MIVWRGWGLLALLILGAGGGGGTAVGIALGGPANGGNWGTVVGLLLAAVALRYAGRKLNKPKQYLDRSAGEWVIRKNVHTFFWVPIQHLSPVAAAIGGVVGVLILVR